MSVPEREYGKDLEDVNDNGSNIQDETDNIPDVQKTPTLGNEINIPDIPSDVQNTNTQHDSDNIPEDTKKTPIHAPNLGDEINIPDISLDAQNTNSCGLFLNINFLKTEAPSDMSLNTPVMPNAPSGTNITIKSESELKEPIMSFANVVLKEFRPGSSKDGGKQEKDNKEDVLPIITSTNIKVARKEPSGAEKKRAKIRKEFLANISMTKPEDPQITKQKDEMFAMAYYDKMMERLDMKDYTTVHQILNEDFKGVVELYNKLIKVLRPKYEDLADEFLLFLREKEAADVNELIPWIRVNYRSKFLRKLEIHFKDQPAQLRKIYAMLTELSNVDGVTMDMVKSKLLPLFKGNTLLQDLFLQNFLFEKPPTSLLEGPHETIDLDKELLKLDDEEPYENLTIPTDIEDKYGGVSCICNCHEIEDHEYKTRFRHCIKCGTRFINGRVFISAGRGVRPATVSFLTNPDQDHSARLIGQPLVINTPHKKRPDSSPSKQATGSPTKEGGEEESDDDVKKPKKTPRKRRQAVKVSNATKDSRKSVSGPKKLFSEPSDNGSPVRKKYRQIRKRSNSVSKSRVKKNAGPSPDEDKSPLKPGWNRGQHKRLVEDISDNDDVPTTPDGFITTPLDQKPSSPGQNTAESESEFCEESSQDNCESDTDSSTTSQSQSDNNVEEISWKREEDKIILETFRAENDKEVAFRSIARQLGDRSRNQIRKRFDTLMRILMETIGK